MNKYKRGIPAWRDTRPFLFRLIIMLGDGLSVALAYALAYWVRFYFPPFVSLFPLTKGLPSFNLYILSAPVIIFMWILALSWENGYRRLTLPAIDEGIRILKGSFTGTILAMSAMFLYRDASYSRLVFVMGGVFTFGFLYLYRQTLKISYLFWVRRTGKAKRVLVLGKGRLADSLTRILERHGDRVVLTKSDLSSGAVEKAITRSQINEVLVAKSQMNHKEIIRLAGFCEDRGVIFRILPDILELRMGEVLIDESLGLPTIQIRPVSLHGTSFVTKRVMDIVLASTVLLILSVPLAIIAFLIKVTSRGPVLYQHQRMGYRGRPFWFYKFRTMIIDADAQLAKLKRKSDRPGPVFKMKNDPRVTSIGRFLRRYSIDEIPQVINVLKGEMSLVGPRPQVLWEAKNYDEWAKKRLNVLPGITGLWQVSGRAELTYEEMIEMDIFYIENWSPGMDIKIMARTIPAVLFGKGAY